MTVSIIIPAHNSIAFIDKAIVSALSQDMVAVEVIVIDDGSSDGTADRVESNYRGDHRVRLIRNAIAGGPGAARNIGLAHATGEWIALLDSDDEFKPSRCRVLLDVAEARRCDMVIDGLELVDFASGASLGDGFKAEWLTYQGEVTLAYMLERDWPGRHRCLAFGTAKPMFKRALVVENGLRYDEDLRIGEDILFYAGLFLAGARACVTNENLYRYAIRPTSLSAQPKPTTQLIEANRRIGERQAKFVSRDPSQRALADLIRSREAALWFQFFTWSLKVGQFGGAFRAFRQLKLGFLAQELADRLSRRTGRLNLAGRS